MSVNDRTWADGQPLHNPVPNPEMDKVQSYPWFDWLRFVLASIVVLGHANFLFAPFLTGKLAVSVFFALSGWLIGGILLRTEKSELPRFFFNRSTRIWLPYLAAIILLYGIAALREGVDFFWLKYLVMDITFTHQLFTFFPVAAYEMPLDGSGNQFWSIAVEEQFYLLAPLVMLFVKHGKSLLLWLLIALLLVLPGSVFGPISLGVCAAILQRDYGIANYLHSRLIALAVVLVSVVILAVGNPSWASYAGPILSVALVVCLAIPGKRSKIALFFGGLSYPLYLNHWFGLALANGLSKYVGLSQSPLLPFLCFLAAIAITIPMYWCIDRQISEHRNRWFTPALGKRLGIIAYVSVVVGIILGILMYQYGPHGVVPVELAPQ